MGLIMLELGFSSLVVMCVRAFVGHLRIYGRVRVRHSEDTSTKSWESFIYELLLRLTYSCI